MKERKATVVVDLSFGDAGKGTIVDFLSRQENAKTIIRFNGGGQAAHNVITPDGRHHTFAQFGSGTFVPGILTHLSRFMLVDPFSMENEARHLAALGCGDPFTRLSVDEQAFVVTPFHKAGNRLRETLRNKDRHGSCGMGIGETMADSFAHPDLTVRVADLSRPDQLIAKLKGIREVKYEEFNGRFNELSSIPSMLPEIEMLSDPFAVDLFAAELQRIAARFKVTGGEYLAALADRGDLIFEGAQGVLIDEWHGFHPYTTWSTTTPANALQLLQEIGYDGSIECMGVLRAYFTRHGAGPFPTEDETLSSSFPDVHNGTGQWQGSFRVGWFDEVLARYAIAVSGRIDSLAITHLDRLAAFAKRKICSRYEMPFSLHHEEVRDLKPKPILTDLVYQESLTRLLTQAVPVYEDAPLAEKDYLQRLEKSLAVPVSIVSRGQTALEKEFFQKRKNRTVVAQ